MIFSFKGVYSLEIEVEKPFTINKFDYVVLGIFAKISMAYEHLMTLTVKLHLASLINFSSGCSFAKISFVIAAGP